MLLALVLAVAASAGADEAVSTGGFAGGFGGGGARMYNARGGGGVASSRAYSDAAPPPMAMPMMAKMSAGAPSFAEAASDSSSFVGEGGAGGRGGGGGGAPNAAGAPGSLADTVAAMAAAGAAAGSGSGGAPPLAGAVVLRSGSMSVEALDVSPLVAALAAAADAAGGFVESSSTSTDEWLLSAWRGRAGGPPEGAPTHAHVALRVPPGALDATRARVAAAAAAARGRVTAESTSAVDVSETYVDALARAKVEEGALAQLGVLLSAAASVADVLAVRREQNAVLGRLESAKATRKHLEARAALASLAVSVAAPQPPPDGPPPPPPGWSVARSWEGAVAAAAAAGRRAVDVALLAAVFALPVGGALAAGGLALRAAARAVGGAGGAGGAWAEPLNGSARA